MHSGITPQSILSDVVIEMWAAGQCQIVCKAILRGLFWGFSGGGEVKRFSGRLQYNAQKNNFGTVAKTQSYTLVV